MGMNRPIAFATLFLALLLAACGAGHGSQQAHKPSVTRSATLRLEKRFQKPASSHYGIHHIYKMTSTAGPPSIPAPGAAPASSSTAKTTKLPPASAGSNGTTVAPNPGSRSGTKLARLSERMAAGGAALLGGVALPPASAPAPIQAAIRAANSLVGQPYVWGGGHSSWYSHGYDCSGSVSFALGAAGFLRAPLDSTRLASWGKPGPGRWLTVFANSSHAFAVIDGLRWDTVGDAHGSGPRWHNSLDIPSGFVARHPPGY